VLQDLTALSTSRPIEIYHKRWKVDHCCWFQVLVA
jgi:hypothetical protein